MTDESVDAVALNVEDAILGQKLTLTFRHICYRRKDLNGGRPKDIIKNVSGNFQPGRLVAILGPSGAGKSSLLGILSGLRQTGFIGTIEVNGYMLDRRKYRQQCVYIQQDINLTDHLTVLETMNYAAELKMSSKSEMVRKKKVNDILHILGLDNGMRTLVKKLSGGEKKRLSIGIEMVSNPPIILLDEPTSGLDSVSAMELMSYVKTVASEGRTVACVIHQPSSSLFQLFDDLYLLSAGMCIYNGPLDAMVGTFADTGFHCPKFYNRADFALEVASKPLRELEQLVHRYSKLTNDRKQSRHKNNIKDDDFDVPPPPEEDIVVEHTKHTSHGRYQISQWKQFYVLLRRSLRVTSRDFFFAQLRVIAHILVGVLLGAVFYNSGQDGALVMVNGACLFFFQLFIFFGNSMPCVITFPLETKVFIRERLNNWYSLEAYYLSKIVADLPLQIICPSLFLMLAYYLTGQPLEWERFGKLCLILLLLGIFAQTVGLLSGAAFDIQMATFFVPCFSIPSLLFSGFFVKSYEMNEYLSYIAYTSFFRYSLQGSLQAIYGGNRTAFPCSKDICYYNKPSKFLKFMDTRDDGFWENVSSSADGVAVLRRDVSQQCCIVRHAVTMASSEEIELKRMSTPLQDFVPSTIRFRNVVYRTNEKEILSNISGRFQHGRLVALMGPSGAGKSSLLNVLSGAQMFGMIGSVTINGEPVEENDPRSVYVEQECPLLMFLTVQETMQFAVDMKMPQRSFQSVKEAKIDDILEMVGLDDARNTVVRNLSGGEQRRLAVAVELITNPPIMLLDEPTSGLDSVSSTQVISHLKSLAMSGRTIVCTIHQPASSLFQLFDDVYLLRQGRCLYTGPVDNMLARFARVGLRCPEYYNPADFALESISANQPEAHRLLCQLVDEEMREINAGAPSSPTTLAAQLAPGKSMARYQTACYYQLYTLLKRSVLSSARDEFFLKIRLGMHLALGLVFGAVHYDAGSEAAKVLANVGCFFQLFAFVYFTNAVSVVNYADEVKVAIKEIANNWYSREAYFFAKLIHDLPLQLFCPSFLLAIVYYLTGQPMEWVRFGMLLGVFAVGGVIGQSLGLIGGICFDVKMQNFFVANACIVPILFSGFFVNAGDMISILRPLSTVSFFRYQFHGAMQALYGYDRDNMPCGQVYCYYKKPSTILEQFDIDAYGYGTSITKALVLVLIMQLIIYVGFMVRLRRIK
uniref:ABC transporter domain-containing protein n=1 Tax=Anopheles culicifacies TaxID=139723 RepID=A0A182M564_9DIPT